MRVLPEPAVIIGQMGFGASGLLGGPGAGGPGALRAPVFLPDLVNQALFEPHWLYWGAGAALALILVHLGRSRANRQLVRAGMTLVGVVAVWMLLAYMMDTPAERLYRAHAEMAKAASVGDIDKILSYFGPDFQCEALDIQVPASAHEEIATRLKNFGIKSNRIIAYHTDISGPTASTTLSVTTEIEGGGSAGKVTTTWRLTWEDLPREDWRVEQAEFLALEGQPVGGSGGKVPRELPHF